MGNHSISATWRLFWTFVVPLVVPSAWGLAGLYVPVWFDPHAVFATGVLLSIAALGIGVWMISTSTLNAELKVFGILCYVMFMPIIIGTWFILLALSFSRSPL